MAHQVLARKWRPRSFADVIGQDHVVRALANALDSGRIHHAYLFTGTRGVGKTTLARILAKALNCETGLSSKPCGKCQACVDIDAGRFVDLLEVDAATNTKVDEMRELLETAQYAPVSGRYKVYIIDEVHMLSKSAFNAMLKTLEEPPGHVEFVLATTDPQKLPITVLSRCLQFNLKNLPPPLIVEHLAGILQAEGIAFERTALELLGRAAEGSARDALSLLDQAIAYGAGSVGTAQVGAMLGSLDQSYLFAMLEALRDVDAKRMVAEISELAGRSVSFDMTLKELAALLSRIALVQSAGPGSVEGPDAGRITQLGESLGKQRVQLYYQIALLGRRDLPLSPDEQSGFTMTMLRMLSFAGQVNSSTEAIDSPAASQRQTISAAASAASPQLSVLPRHAGETSPTKLEDWPAFVASLGLAGMAGMLAKQCELLQFADGVLELRLPEAQKHLAEKAYQEKLRSELVGKLGSAVRVQIKIGEASGQSLAAQEVRDREARQATAEAEIANDPFIKTLKQDFGAEVLRETIRPAAGPT